MVLDYLIESPVALLLTEAQGKLHLVTTNSFSEAAHYPTTLWVSVDRTSKACENLIGNPYFSLVVLHSEQQEIARAFRDGGTVECLPSIAVKQEKNGFYYIEDMLAVAFCNVRERHDVAECTLFIGDILNGFVNTGRTYFEHLLLSKVRGGTC
jgi:flavin reductase (DIM6/NTAB) family NADH-FMN oxidoreductase RutF